MLYNLFQEKVGSTVLHMVVDQLFTLMLILMYFNTHSQAYLQRLAALEKQPSFQHVAFRCICTLLDAVPYFNFREDLLGIVIKNISSSDEVVRLCYICTYFLIFSYGVENLTGCHLKLRIEP